MLWDSIYCILAFIVEAFNLWKKISSFRYVCKGKDVKDKSIFRLSERWCGRLGQYWFLFAPVIFIFLPCLVQRQQCHGVHWKRIYENGHNENSDGDSTDCYDRMFPRRFVRTKSKKSYGYDEATQNYLPTWGTTWQHLWGSSPAQVRIAQLHTERRTWVRVTNEWTPVQDGDRKSCRWA